MRIYKKRRFDRKIITLECQAIKELRLDLGMTLQDAGERLGLSSKTIGAIENGRLELDPVRLEKIISSYGLSKMNFVRAKRLIKRNGIKKRDQKVKVKTVLSNSDRRSYQKIITKECRLLKSLRRQKNLSQYDASALCGYSHPTIGHIENGRIELDQGRIKHIVECYGYQLTEFESCLGKEELRDEIIDYCVEKIVYLDEQKLGLVKGILVNL